MPYGPSCLGRSLLPLAHPTFVRGRKNPASRGRKCGASGVSGVLHQRLAKDNSGKPRHFGTRPQSAEVAPRIAIAVEAPAIASAKRKPLRGTESLAATVAARSVASATACAANHGLAECSPSRIAQSAPAPRTRSRAPSALVSTVAPPFSAALPTQPL